MELQNAAHQASGETLGQQIARTVRGIIGIVAILSAIVLFNPAWGSWTRLAVVPLAASVLLFVLVLTVRVLNRLRSARRQRLVAGLAPLFGQEWDPKDLVASKFSKGRPTRLKIKYPDSIPDRDPTWRKRVEEMAQQRMEAEQITTQWDSRRGRVVIEAKTTTTDQGRQEVAEKQAQQRIHDILRPMFGADLKITVTEWQDDEKEKA